MHHTEYNRNQVVKYLIWTFVLAYIIQFGAALIYNGGNTMICQSQIAAMMIIPVPECCFPVIAAVLLRYKEEQHNSDNCT